MAKTSVKQKAGSKRLPAPRQNRPLRKNESSAKITTRSSTKQARAIEMLRSKDGASISALMKVTGWQPHSVRGFLAGVVRKRLKLDLVSAVDAGVRTYRITSAPAATSSKVQSARPKSA